MQYEDIKNCIDCGEIIEEYPNDYPHPSCLIYGKSTSGKVIHIVVGCDDDILYMVTAYYPNTEKFESDLKTRKE
jgi:hypothetical protein